MLAFACLQGREQEITLSDLVHVASKEQEAWFQQKESYQVQLSCRLSPLNVSYTWFVTVSDCTVMQKHPLHAVAFTQVLRHRLVAYEQGIARCHNQSTVQQCAQMSLPPRSVQ